MLRVILERLPSHSHYITARKNDPEQAMAVARRSRDAAKAGVEGPRWRPAATEWPVSVELAAAVVDRLGEVEALLADLPIAGRTRRATPPKRTSRPETGIERAEQQLAVEHYESILAEVEEAKARWRALQDG